MRQVTVQAYNSSGSPVGSGEVGEVYVPRSPQAISHDDDGNLTDDGRWTYTWDAENRLAAMATQP